MAGVSGGLSGTHEIAAREDKAFSVGEKISAYNVRNSGAEVSQRVWKEIKARCRTIEPNWRQVSQRVWKEIKAGVFGFGVTCETGRIF